MLEYLIKAISVWLIGFAPFLEIYVAVPAGLAMGLDGLSVILWSVAGNIAPILLINFCYATLARSERFGRWLDRLISQRMEQWVNRYGPWFVIVTTPWIGVWVVAATLRVLRMESRAVLWYSFLSILIYAVVLTVLIQLGVDWFTGDK